MLNLDDDEIAIVDVALRMAIRGLSDSPDGRYLRVKMTEVIDRIAQRMEDVENGDAK